MSTHLITGFAGREHITSADQGSFNAALLGTGQFALERGEQFRCQVISNNKVRIFDGDALMQGRHIMIDRNTYEETTHDNGTQGYKRIDLIVFTYTKNASSGIESVSLDVIKGTPAASNPAVPTYTTGDIVDEGELKNQMPLYQIPFDGLSIGTPVKMFETISTLETMKEGMETEISEAVSSMEETIDEAVTNMSGIVLDDLDDIESCNQPGYIAGALAVKELNSNLVATKTSSMNEKIIGTWFDGKPLYRKYKICSITPKSALTWNSFPDESIETMEHCSFEGSYCVHSSGNFCPAPYFENSNNLLQVIASKETNAIRTFSANYVQTVVVCMTYTKTTD